MYGLVNRAVEDYVSKKHGPAAWKLIEQRLGVERSVFVNHQQYPDEHTYELVAITSEELDTDPIVLLRELGTHWIGFAARSGYAELFTLAGPTFVDFLRNLDSLHARVGMSFPELRPPSFHVSDVEPDGLRLHYHSYRAGLAPFVEGLIAGLAARFDVRVEITHLVKRDNSSHDQFLIRYS
jgi:hypothetical protein